MENNTENKFLTKTFFLMALGLLGTAIIAWYTYSSGLCYELALSGGFSIVAIIELIAVLVFSFCFKKLSPTVAGIIFFAYAFLNGVTLSSIFAIYDITSIGYIFIVTSALFAVLALIGYKTNKDLSNWSTILSVTLLVGIIASLINLFVGNTMIDLAITWVMLILFFGITVYDINKLKRLSEEPELNQEKLYIYGALDLYLDFINIFLKLLRLFAKNRD